jgi:hypothetical protein
VGIAKTVGEDGCDVGVQGVSKNMQKSAQSILEGDDKLYMMNVLLRDAAHKFALTNMSTIQRWLM